MAASIWRPEPLNSRRSRSKLGGFYLSADFADLRRFSSLICGNLRNLRINKALLAGCGFAALCLNIVVQPTPRR
jgi:hypothetical protein